MNCGKSITKKRQRQVQSIRRHWAEKSIIERAQAVAELRSGVSNRALARALGLDEGTIRRLLRIHQLPAGEREAIAAGRSAKEALQDARGRQLEQVRRDRETADATTHQFSREYAAVILRWLADCDLRGPVAERVLDEIEVLIWFRRNVPPATAVAPVGSCLQEQIERLRPKQLPETLWVEYYIEWGARWMALLMPERPILDKAISMARTACFTETDYVSAAAGPRPWQTLPSTPKRTGAEAVQPRVRQHCYNNVSWKRMNQIASSLSGMEAFILALVEHGQARTMYALQKEAGLQPGGILPAVRKLERSGLLARAKTGARRRRDFSVTRAGRRALSQWSPVLAAGLQPEAIVRAAWTGWIVGHPDPLQVLERGMEMFAERAHQHGLAVDKYMQENTATAVYRRMLAFCNALQDQAAVQAFRDLLQQLTAASRGRR